MGFYHVLNRGVDKRNIFLDGRDRARFVHDLYEFNDTKAANNTLHRSQHNDLRSRYVEIPREKIVDIHGWCLMNNHYHLLLSERVDGGIVKFIRRLNIGYAKYFNERYKRTGTLFQGRTKKILIKSDGHFLHILHYIHLNPLDYLPQATSWREHKLSNATNAFAHLEKYRWSSFLDYVGNPNFPSIITPNFFADFFGNYRKEILHYLHDIEISNIKNFLLE